MIDRNSRLCRPSELRSGSVFNVGMISKSSDSFEESSPDRVEC